MHIEKACTSLGYVRLSGKLSVIEQDALSMIETDLAHQQLSLGRWSIQESVAWLKEQARAKLQEIEEIRMSDISVF